MCFEFLRTPCLSCVIVHKSSTTPSKWTCRYTLCAGIPLQTSLGRQGETKEESTLLVLVTGGHWNEKGREDKGRCATSRVRLDSANQVADKRRGSNQRRLPIVHMSRERTVTTEETRNSTKHLGDMNLKSDRSSSLTVIPESMSIFDSDSYRIPTRRAKVANGGGGPASILCR